jgi:hypothetical protein
MLGGLAYRANDRLTVSSFLDTYETRCLVQLHILTTNLPSIRPKDCLKTLRLRLRGKKVLP